MRDDDRYGDNDVIVDEDGCSDDDHASLVLRLVSYAIVVEG